MANPNRKLIEAEKITHIKRDTDIGLLMAFSISSRIRFLHNMMFSKTNKQTTITTAAAAAVAATATMIGFMQFPHCSVVILSYILFIFASLENYSASFCSRINCVGYAQA